MSKRKNKKHNKNNKNNNSKKTTLNNSNELEASQEKITTSEDIANNTDITSKNNEKDIEVSSNELEASQEKITTSEDTANNTDINSKNNEKDIEASSNELEASQEEINTCEDIANSTDITSENEEKDIKINNESDIDKSKDNKITNLQKIVKSIILKNKRLLSYIIVATISSALSCTLLKLHLNNSTQSMTDSSFSNDINNESNKSISDIMNKIETNNMIKIKPSYPLDYTFDSIFDNIRDNALAIETSVLPTKDNLQEIFIIKTTDTETAELELQNYKDSLIEMYKEKGQKEELKIAKNIVIESIKDITYFIAAENYMEIKELIHREIE